MYHSEKPAFMNISICRRAVQTQLVRIGSNSQARLTLLALLILSTVNMPGAAAPAYPLKASANRRYLVDQNNQPVLLVGDSPHALFANLSVAEATSYLQNRGANGFNALWCEVLVTPDTGGRTNLSTYDGIVPFTTANDISTPNPAYFARVDQMIAIAAANGLTVFLDTFETHYLETFLEAQTATKMFDYGVFLGNRYKNTPNLVWMTGNDFNYWNSKPTANNLIKELMRGIASVDSNHLQTLQLNVPNSGSLDNTLAAPYVTLNGAYNYYVTYDEVLKQYNKPNYVPVYLQEAAYEDEANVEPFGGTPNLLRRQAYWTVLAGGLAGQMYGHLNIWRFSAGWQSSLNTTGVQQLGYWKEFITSKAWYDLVPDQTHKVVTAGYGTYKTAASQAFGSENDYVTTARSSDGTLVLAYTPLAHTLTVDMTKLAGSVTARWFDPTAGTYSSISGSPFANTGKQDFRTPGNNSVGDDDWVLVLESLSGVPQLQMAGAYSGLFHESDQVRQSSAGFFTLSVTSGNKYSGRLQVGVSRLRISGQLNPLGQATNIIPRSDASPLTVELQIGTNAQADQIFGRVTDGTWVATLRGDRAVFSSKSNPSPYAKRYVLVNPGPENDPSVPAGESFGAVRVDSSGKVRFAGTLADGTKVSQSTTLSKDGHWPFYVSLYSGQGSVVSWLTFTNQASDDLNGMLSWIRPADARARYYPDGFVRESRAVGSIFIPPTTPADHFLNLTNASVVFSDGNLTSDFTNAVVLGLGSRIGNLSSNRFTMSFSRSTGTFKGKAADPTTGESFSFNGGVLQKLNTGRGFFLGTSQSGRVSLSP